MTACRLARQQAMLEERQVQEVELRRLDQELAQRDAQLADLHQQLQQMHRELTAATSGLQAATARRAAEADGSATRLAEARQCVQQLAHTVRLLLGTLAQLGTAAAAAAELGSTQVKAGRVLAEAGGQKKGACITSRPCTNCPCFPASLQSRF